MDFTSRSGPFRVRPVDKRTDARLKYGSADALGEG